MSLSIYAVYGSSGFGREVLPLLRDKLDRENTNDYDLVFIDDYAESLSENGTRVVTYEEFLKTPADNRYVVIAIADSRIRAKLAEQCSSDGVTHIDILASNAMILDGVEMGEGSLLCPFSMITSNVRVGKFFHANIYSYVAHDCVIGDYVTFAPAVKCNGNVVIEDHAYIGTGAILKQGTPDKPLTIGAGAVVGMGAVVTKDVPPGAVVIGNPARPLVKN